MPSEIQIANLALSRAGGNKIAAFADANKEGRAITRAYEPTRDALIRRFNWKFALTRASLAALVSVPDWGYTYEYQLPSDNLRIVQVNDYYLGLDLSDFRGSSSAEFEIEGQKILTDFAAPLKIRYLKRITDTNLFDALFTKALVIDLAHEICEDVVGSGSLKDRLQKDLEDAIYEAKKASAIEALPKYIADDSWLASRF